MFTYQQQQQIDSIVAAMPNYTEELKISHNKYKQGC